MNAFPSSAARFAAAFSTSAGLLLLALGLAHLLGNQGRELVQPPDPVLVVSSRYLFWGLGGVELIVALVCLWARSPQLPAVLVAWLTSNLLVYRVALFWFGVYDVKAYYDTMANAFGVSVRTMDVLMTLAVAYLLVGSCVALLRLWWHGKRGAGAGLAADEAADVSGQRARPSGSA